MSSRETARRLLRAVQQDEGGRGIMPLVEAAGGDALWLAAMDLLHADKIVLLTGFPCLQHDADSDEWGSKLSPQETDGPPGIAAVARALEKTGKKCIVAIDHPNAIPVELSVRRALGLSGEAEFEPSSAEGKVAAVRISDSVEMRCFPPKARWSEDAQNALEELAQYGEHFLALERAGTSRDGTCRTMRGRVMGDELLAPLHLVFDRTKFGSGARSTGIGDGGNELGMGTVVEAVQKTVTHGPEIACTIPADNTLVCSVSNWGGYAVAAAISVAAHDNGMFHSLEESVTTVMGDRETALSVLEACVMGGARDGISRAGNSVDSFDFGKNLDVFSHLSSLALGRHP